MKSAACGNPVTWPMSRIGGRNAVAEPSVIATAKADSRKQSCLLCCRKRTDAVQNEMSAKGQKRTSFSYSITASARC